MTSSERLLVRATEEFGRLVGVRGSREEPEDGPVGDLRQLQYLFEFERGQFAVIAQGDDDTIVVDGDFARDGVITDLADRHPWSELIGSTLLWTWVLTNQQGYVDAFQAEFVNDGVFRSVQLVCEASALTAYQLVRVT